MMMMRQARKLLLLLGVFALLPFWDVVGVSNSQPAMAGWFHKKKAPVEASPGIESFQPPAADALTVDCDAFRIKAVTLRQKPVWIRWLYMPSHAHLVSKHHQCVKGVMEQEMLYLKHVDIEQPPTLPKLPVMPTEPSKMP
jgi:hypothetical protein